jgi:hypothetical protein
VRQRLAGAAACGCFGRCTYWQAVGRHVQVLFCQSEYLSCPASFQVMWVTVQTTNEGMLHTIQQQQQQHSSWPCQSASQG